MIVHAYERDTVKWTQIVAAIAFYWLLLQAQFAWSATPMDTRPIVATHDTTANPFLLPHDGIPFGDPFPVCWDGVWHLYALTGKGLNRVNHFTSSDLVHWAEHEPAMLGKGIATGTVVRHENMFYMFYTDAGPQTIRLVTSDNPWHFDFARSKLVAKADNEVYQLSRRKFRDCYVFYNEQEQLWWMLLEATCDGSVAVGLFKSKDLLTWAQYDPIFKDKSRAHGSCPQVFQNEQTWYLALLDYPTWYYSADSLFGPWQLRGHYHTKRLTAASRWATDGHRRVAWGFFTRHPTPERESRGYGGPLGVGREMVFDGDGDIGVRPLPELIQAIREPEGNANLFNCARQLTGCWIIDAERQEFRCTDEDGGVLLLDLPEENPNYYFETDVELGGPAASGAVVVRSSEHYDEGYRVVMQPCKKTIAIRQFGADGGTFDEREHAFPGGMIVHVQAFACDGQIEVFIDGWSSLSARVEGRSESRLAIGATHGPATFKRPLLHYFRDGSQSSMTSRGEPVEAKAFHR